MLVGSIGAMCPIFFKVLRYPLANSWGLIFTCVASQHLILCDITAATTTATPIFLKCYLE